MQNIFFLLIFAPLNNQTHIIMKTRINNLAKKSNIAKFFFLVPTLYVEKLGNETDICLAWLNLELELTFEK